MTNQKIDCGNNAGTPIFPLYGAMGTMFLDPVIDTNNAIEQLVSWFTLEDIAEELEGCKAMLRNSEEFKDLEEKKQVDYIFLLDALKEFVAAIYYYNPDNRGKSSH